MEELKLMYMNQHTRYEAKRPQEFTQSMTRLQNWPWVKQGTDKLGVKMKILKKHFGHNFKA